MGYIEKTIHSVEVYGSLNIVQAWFSMRLEILENVANERDHDHSKESNS